MRCGSGSASMSPRAPAVNSGMLADVLASTSRSIPAGRPDHVLDREPPAPRLAEQVAAVEAERRAHLVELLHRPLDRPERRVVGMVGAAAAELVVDDHRAVLRQPLGQGQQVIARRPGPPCRSSTGMPSRGPIRADQTLPPVTSTRRSSVFAVAMTGASTTAPAPVRPGPVRRVMRSAADPAWAGRGAAVAGEHVARARSIPEDVERAHCRTGCCR